MYTIAYIWATKSMEHLGENFHGLSGSIVDLQKNLEISPSAARFLRNTGPRKWKTWSPKRLENKLENMLETSIYIGIKRSWETMDSLCELFGVENSRPAFSAGPHYLANMSNVYYSQKNGELTWNMHETSPWYSSPMEMFPSYEPFLGSMWDLSGLNLWLQQQRLTWA